MKFFAYLCPTVCVFLFVLLDVQFVHVRVVMPVNVSFVCCYVLLCILFDKALVHIMGLIFK